MSENSRARIIVSGRVQGVWYRLFARNIAEELGLTGWVKNRSDGTVEAEIEGDRGNIDDLLKELHKGPPLARVYNMDITWLPFENRYNKFEIRY